MGFWYQGSNVALDLLVLVISVNLTVYPVDGQVIIILMAFLALDLFRSGEGSSSECSDGVTVQQQYTYLVVFPLWLHQIWLHMLITRKPS